MAKFAELKIIVDNLKELSKFKNKFRKEVIENGLDIPLAKSIPDLKTQLKFLVNEQIRNEKTTAPSGVTEKTNNLGQPTVDIPKSEEELLRHLTKADVTKYNKAKDFTTLSEANIVFGHFSRGPDTFNRVTLRMNITPGDTVESHYQKAQEFFQNAVFALPGDNGKMEYYVNAGADLSDYLKIKCSPDIGYDNAKSKNRFELDRDNPNKGFAEWTLLQEGVEKIKNGSLDFIKISDIMELTKDGDYEEARTVTRRKDRNNRLNEVDTQIEKLDKQEDLSPTIESYSNIIALINNIKISKRIRKDTVTYNLISRIGQKTGNFYDLLTTQIKQWTIFGNEERFKSLIQATDKVIKRFTSKK